MRRIGVTGQVVHVAQYFLVGSYEEDTEVIRLVVLECVQRKYITNMAIGHKVGYFSIAVAGDVL